MNSAAPVKRCTKADVAVYWVLDIGAFDLKRTLEMDPEFLNTDGEHEHDTSVSSVSITVEDKQVDFALFDEWTSGLLRNKGTDLYRMKGVLNVRFATQKYVYHAVHMIFNGDFETWDEEEEKSNKLVFIGKNIDAAGLRAGFMACLATPENLERKLNALRFKKGDRVECNMGDSYSPGTITELLYRDDEMEQGQVCPYKIALDNGTSTWAPYDEDDTIRREGNKKRRTS